jgi:PKD repeat protein
MDTSLAEFILHPSPKAAFTVTPESQMFPETLVTIDNQTNTGNWKYLWDFGDDFTTDSINPVNHNYQQIGNYTVRLLVKSTYCADSTEHRIKILPHPPVADFIILLNLVVCL